MGFTSDFNRPAMGNAIDDDFDWMRDNWHYILSVAASGSIVLPGWQTTTQGPDKSEPTSITLTRGTKKIIIYYTWTSNSVSSIQFCYDNGVGDTSPSVTCYPAINFFYDSSGNPYGTVDPTLAGSTKHFWEFEEASGGPWLDAIGSVDMTQVGSITQATGLVNNAAFINATGEYMINTADVPTADMATTGSFHMTGWIYFTAFNGTNSYSGILHKSKTTFGTFANSLDFVLAHTTSVTTSSPVKPKGFYAWFSFDGSSSKLVSFPHPSGAINTWYWIDLYYDADANEIGIAVDNAAHSTTAVSGTINNFSERFVFGRYYPNDPYLLRARLDQWTWHNRKLSDAERSTIYNSGAGIAYADL